jgi:hydrogenase maturation protease
LIKNVNSGKQIDPQRILIYGYGNPGRQDDALGLRLVEYIEQWAKEHHPQQIDTDQNYQLNIEDADKISQYDIVIFCDASMEDIDPIKLEEVLPDLTTDFSMHSVVPSFVLGVCQQLFNKYPKSFQLHIKGYSWEFMHDITFKAEENLKQAQIFLTEFITEALR